MERRWNGRGRGEVVIFGPKDSIRAYHTALHIHMWQGRHKGLSCLDMVSVLLTETQSSQVKSSQVKSSPGQGW